MLVEAVIAASIGVTIRWIALSLDAPSPFVLPKFLCGWLADFVQISFIVAIMVILLRSPGVAFGDKFLSLRTADIDLLWAIAATAGYFSVETKYAWIKLYRKLRGRVPLTSADVDHAASPGVEKAGGSRDGSTPIPGANPELEGNLEVEYQRKLPSASFVESAE
jgi:hypothetical protein